MCRWETLPHITVPHGTTLLKRLYHSDFLHDKNPLSEFSAALWSQYSSLQLHLRSTKKKIVLDWQEPNCFRSSFVWSLCVNVSLVWCIFPRTIYRCPCLAIRRMEKKSVLSPWTDGAPSTISHFCVFFLFWKHCNMWLWQVIPTLAWNECCCDLQEEEKVNACWKEGVSLPPLLKVGRFLYGRRYKMNHCGIRTRYQTDCHW